MDNIIKLNKKDTLKLDIYTADEKPTGESLEFDLEDINLFLKYQQMLEEHKKNVNWIKNQLVIINKRQDVKGKKFLSKNEEDSTKAVSTFYEKELEIYNLFLGEKGSQKLLNGRAVTWTTLEEIDTIINEQIYPKLKVQMEKIEDKIEQKYKNILDKNKNMVINEEN